MPGCLTADDGNPPVGGGIGLEGGGGSGGGAAGRAGGGGGSGGVAVDGGGSGGGSAGRGGAPAPDGGGGGPSCSAAPIYNCGTDATGTTPCPSGQVCCLSPGCPTAANPYQANGAVSRCVAPGPVNGGSNRCVAPALQLCATSADCGAGYQCDPSLYFCVQLAASYWVPSDPCAGAPGDGDFCGSFLGGSAEPNVIHTCENHAVVAMAICDTGCVHMGPGTPDRCKQ